MFSAKDDALKEAEADISASLVAVGRYLTAHSQQSFLETSEDTGYVTKELRLLGLLRLCGMGSYVLSGRGMEITSEELRVSHLVSGGERLCRTLDIRKYCGLRSFVERQLLADTSPRSTSNVSAASGDRGTDSAGTSRKRRSMYTLAYADEQICVPRGLNGR